ncbi:hypothetical protein [Streptomyces sp. NBC_01718]|uniref:hypothetical protein n=1 Tax=Streptomyces sp. NBC_01718 TaxID=2975919 RepID=UPI00352BDF74
MLGPLGVSAEQEQLYTALISRPGSTAEELARRTAVALPGTTALLEDMAAQGLVVDEGVNPLPGPDRETTLARTYRASSPSIALTPPAARQRTALDQAESAVLALTEQFRSIESRSADGVVEVVRDPVRRTPPLRPTPR